MSFDLNGLSEVRALNFGRRYHAYDTTDTLSAVLAAGYFDAGWYRLGARDRLDIEASDGRIMAVVSAASSGGVTITASTDVTPANALGPGSVARSVEDELRQIRVPVTRFGADPAGVRDSTQAFQDAIHYIRDELPNLMGGDHGGGGTLFVPAGFYRLDYLNGTSGLSTITIDFANFYMEGEGLNSFLLTRSPDTRVGAMFTISKSGVRCMGGGFRNLRLDGNCQTDYAVKLDSWKTWRMEDVQGVDLFGAVLLGKCDQAEGGEDIRVRNVSYKPSTSSGASANCLVKNVVRFQSGTNSRSWADCSISGTFGIGCWEAALVLDGCARWYVEHTMASCSETSSNTIDGSSKTACKYAIILTNTAASPAAETADSGYHTILHTRLECDWGGENQTDNAVVWIDTPTGQTGYNRYNVIENADTTNGANDACLLRITNTSASLYRTALNTFRNGHHPVNKRRLIQIGANVTDTDLYLKHGAGLNWKVVDNGIRTVINGTRNFAFSNGLYPTALPNSGETDVGQIVRDLTTGRVVWHDRFGRPVLIGPRPGTDVMAPAGAQRISGMSAASAPTVTPYVDGSVTPAGSTTYTYYVVAIDKDGNKAVPSSAGATSTGQSNLALYPNIVTWRPVEGAVTYDLLKGDTSTSVALGLTTTYFEDTAPSTAAYTPSAVAVEGTLRVDGHVNVSGSTTPTIAAGAAAGTSPTVSITGYDQTGHITIVVGTSPTTGHLATITFGSSKWQLTPRVPVIGPANANAAANAKIYADPAWVSTTGWRLYVDTALTAGTTYILSYRV